MKRNRSDSSTIIKTWQLLILIKHPIKIKSDYQQIDLEIWFTNNRNCEIRKKKSEHHKFHLQNLAQIGRARVVYINEQWTICADIDDSADT